MVDQLPVNRRVSMTRVHGVWSRPAWSLRGIIINTLSSMKSIQPHCSIRLFYPMYFNEWRTDRKYKCASTILWLGQKYVNYWQVLVAISLISLTECCFHSLYTSDVQFYCNNLSPDYCPTTRQRLHTQLAWKPIINCGFIQLSWDFSGVIANPCTISYLHESLSKGTK